MQSKRKSYNRVLDISFFSSLFLLLLSRRNETPASDERTLSTLSDLGLSHIDREEEKMSVRGGNSGKGNNGISSIPAASRKMVQSLKEIVSNCTEQEIYATLKECNMDPDETVNRLLSQGPIFSNLSLFFITIFRFRFRFLGFRLGGVVN